MLAIISLQQSFASENFRKWEWTTDVIGSNVCLSLDECMQSCEIENKSWSLHPFTGSRKGSQPTSLIADCCKQYHEGEQAPLGHRVPWLKDLRPQGQNKGMLSEFCFSQRAVTWQTWRQSSFASNSRRRIGGLQSNYLQRKPQIACQTHQAVHMGGMCTGCSEVGLMRSHCMLPFFCFCLWTDYFFISSATLWHLEQLFLLSDSSCKVGVNFA